MPSTDVTSGTGLSGSYINSLDGFVGQERAKQQLRVLINTAQLDDAPLPHLLLASGYEGLGKTNLALLVASEMGVPLKLLAANSRPSEALQMIERLRRRSVVFVDEAHRGVEGGKNKMDWMLQAMENFVIETPGGIEEIPHVTFILATTDAGKLPKALKSRATKITLEAYTDPEADRISINIAASIIGGTLPDPAPGDFAAVARVANNNPRTIRELWKAVRSAYLFDPTLVHQGQGYDLSYVLDTWGLTHDGLTSEAVRYLKIMFNQFSNGAGEKNIADAMHEPSGCHEVEQLLANKGLIQFTKQGRLLTKAGRLRCHDLEAELLA